MGYWPFFLPCLRAQVSIRPDGWSRTGAAGSAVVVGLGSALRCRGLMNMMTMTAVGLAGCLNVLLQGGEGFLGARKIARIERTVKRLKILADGAILP